HDRVWHLQPQFDVGRNQPDVLPRCGVECRDVSKKSRKPAPGTGNAGLGHELHSGQYFRTACAAAVSRHMAEARSNARHTCTTQERPTSHPGSTQCTVCSARSKHPAAARGLAAALEINGELPAMNGGQVGGEGLIVVHGGAALGGDAKHFVWTN